VVDERRRSISGMTSRAARVMLAGLVLVGLIGIVDLYTGPDFGFAFFYFIPIVPVAWSVGRWPGIVVAIAAATMWFYADAALQPAQAFGPVAWNATSRLAIFIAGAWLIDRVKHDRAQMRQIDEQRDEFLRVLEHELPVPAQEMVTALNEAQARGSLDTADIESLRHRAESLAFLTRDFVALGQAQARRLDLRAVPVDVAQLVTEISRERPDHGSVLVTVPGDGLLVTGDPDRLRQAIASVVTEVVSEAGALEYVSINVRARGADALVSISAAMPATATKAVSDEDLRVSLRLARLLLGAMGGSLSVERAALGKGSRVVMRLPVAPATPGGPQPLETSPMRRAR
jgi:K+-sensing histidine kinase KdpD